MKHLLYASPIAMKIKAERGKEPAGLFDSFVEAELSIAGLADHIAHGKSFCLANFNGKQKSELFDSATLAGIDIDGSEYELADLLAMCSAKGLSPAIIYETFNSRLLGKGNRWRIIWQLSEQIYEADEFSAGLKELIKLFPLADKSCNNASRIFYGTNKPIAYIDEQAEIALPAGKPIAQPPPCYGKASYGAELKARINIIAKALESIIKARLFSAGMMEKEQFHRRDIILLAASDFAKLDILNPADIVSAIALEARKYPRFADYTDNAGSAIEEIAWQGIKHANKRKIQWHEPEIARQQLEKISAKLGAFI